MKALTSTKQTLRNIQAAWMAMLLVFISRPSLAAGGLEKATNFVNEITTWAYTFLGVTVLLYCTYLVIMALLEKKQWGDVFVGMGKTAAAGGVIAGATYMWQIWGN